MKSKLFLTCLFILTLAGANGQAKWDSTYRPGLYSFEADLYRSYPHSEKDIMFLGNSITDRVDWNELLGRPDVHNRGISGDITFGVLQRLDEVIDGHPKTVFILIGINDISRNIPDSLILRNYYRIVDRIKKGSPRTKIYFQTLLPVNNEFSQFKNHYNKDEHILWLNEHIKALGKKEHIDVIDLHPHFMDKNGKLDSRYTEDGLHLNAEGYKVWAGILKKFL
ncbi:MAG TPA: GDSL-type esterase/lipase family protein [Chryseosolibacter sp.]|nr:GDSL-type esterase/lipase family protein [Chryseosolibacter sp.]